MTHTHSQHTHLGAQDVELKEAEDRADDQDKQARASDMPVGHVC